MAGLPVFLDAEVSPVQAYAHVPGVARRMNAQAFRLLSAAPGPFHQVLLRYTHAFMMQVAQTAMCVGSHLLQDRCATWLLMTRDRSDAEMFPLTHEFLSLLLGVRRSGVTMSLRALQEKGLIRCSRGQMQITDGPGLERASCECYGMVRSRYAHLLAPAA